MTRPADLDHLTCGNCMHYREPVPQASAGSCWRNPPIPFSVPVQQPAAAGLAVPKNAMGQAAGVMTFPTRPPVNADTGACGEWESEDAQFVETPSETLIRREPADAPDVDSD